MSNRRQISLYVACAIATSTASQDAAALSFGPPYFYGPSYPISGPYETIEDAFDHWLENFVSPQSRDRCKPVIEKHNDDYLMYMDGDGCNYLDEDAVGTYRSPLRGLESENTCLNVVGNPVNSASGTKIETYTDYETVDGLVLSRHYSSAASTARGSFGKGWRSSFDRRLVHTMDGGVEVVSVFRHDASVLRFRRDGEKWVGGRSSDVLTKLRDEKGEMSAWSLVRVGEEVREEYGANGRLLRLLNDAGVLVSLEYEHTEGARERLMRASDVKGRTIRFAHDLSGRTTSVTLPDGSVINYEYDYGIESLDEPDHLKSVVHPDGSRISYGYGEVGRSAGDSVPRVVLIEKVDEAGTVSTFEYDQVGRAISSWRGDRKSVHEFRYAGDGAVSVTYPSGDSVSFEVVRNGGAKRISKVIGACGPECGHRFRSYNWSDAGLLGAATSWDGMSVLFDHDMQGRVTRREKRSPDGSEGKEVVATTWHPQFYSPVDRTEWFGDSLVSSQEWSYNNRGQILTEVDHGLDTGGDRVVSYDYCEQQGVDDGKCPRVGLLLGVRGAREDLEDTYRYEYFMADDPGCGSQGSSCQHRKGDLRRAIDPVGREIGYLSYDDAGRLLSAVGANGEAYAYILDARGRLVERTVTPRGGGAEDARSWRVQYFENGRVRSETDADGVSVSYRYDDADFLVGVFDSVGNSISYERNDAGLVERTTLREPDGSVKFIESSRHNARGERVSGIDARKREVAFTYSDSGNVASARYEGGREDRLSYDSWGRLSVLTEDVNGVMRESRFHHGANERIVGVTDPKGLVTGYLHDARGDLIGMESPNVGAVTLTRDPAGNVVRRVDGRGEIVDYRYDAVNRIVSVKGSEREGISFAYDAKHPDCSKHESHSVGELTWAQADVSSVWCIDPIRNAVREVRRVDGYFQIDHIYEYTRAGRLRRVTYPDGNAVEYHRDAAGRVSSLDLISSRGNRVKLVDDVAHLPFGPLSAWSMVGGRRTKIGYDDRYRPISLSSTGEDSTMNFGLTYTPGATIGEIQESDGNHARVIEHNGMDWVSGSSTDDVVVERYEYDRTGNRVALQRDGKVSQYVYPASNHRLMSVDGKMRQYDDAGNLQNPGDGRALAYDSLGRLSRVERPGRPSAQYGYDGLGRRAWRAIEGKRVHWLYGQDWKWLGEYDDAGRALLQVIWLDDRPVALLVGDDAKVLHVQTDHLGTPRAVVDPDRNSVVWEWKLSGETFGNSKPDEDPDGDGASFTFDMRFPGQRWDEASGYHYNYHRDYDPETGRYVQSDPIGLDGGMGTYLYAENNPLQWTDRWGLDVDIYIWNSLPYEGGIPSAGKLHSIFGHVSVDADGKSYSFNQSGMLRNFDYSDRQTKGRGGDVFRLKLNRNEEVQLAECLDEDHGSYQALSNNCGHPVQNCLRKIGRQLLPFNRTYPSELKYDLLFSPLSKSHKRVFRNKDWSDPSKW